MAPFLLGLAASRVTLVMEAGALVTDEVTTGGMAVTVPVTPILELSKVTVTGPQIVI
jgi:hypothetical protein